MTTEKNKSIIFAFFATMSLLAFIASMISAKISMRCHGYPLMDTLITKKVESIKTLLYLTLFNETLFKNKGEYIEHVKNWIKDPTKEIIEVAKKSIWTLNGLEMNFRIYDCQKSIVIYDEQQKSPFKQTFDNQHSNLDTFILQNAFKGKCKYTKKTEIDIFKKPGHIEDRHLYENIMKELNHENIYILEKERDFLSLNLRDDFEVSLFNKKRIYTKVLTLVTFLPNQDVMNLKDEKIYILFSYYNLDDIC